MSDLPAIPWEPEVWEAELARRGGRPGGSWGRSPQPRYAGGPPSPKRSRAFGRVYGGAKTGAGAFGAAYGSAKKRWPRRHRRPWIFGPWAALPWMASPLEPAAAAPPEEPAPPSPDGGDDASTPPEGAGGAPPEGAGPSPDAEPSELEVHRTVQAPPGQLLRIDWTPVVTIAAPRRSLPGVAGGGIYLVVDKADAPIYVGETGSFAFRWSNPKNGRLIELAQLGLPQPCAPVRAYFGRIAVDPTTRKALEHTVIRTLLNGGLGAALTNVRSRAEFRVRAGVRIDGVLPAPLAARVRFADPNKARFYRNNSLDIPDAAAYEIAVGG